MTNKEIGLAPYHIPIVVSGHYNINASLDNKLNNGLAQNINFHVAGYNAAIPQNEVLAVYPPIDHTGNFAGTFPHIQFRRSTLPWEYKIEGRIKEEACKKALLLNTSEDKINFINENNIDFDQKVYEKIINEKDKLEFLDSILNAVYKYPYVFLILLKEEELKAFKVINTDTNQLIGSTESPAEPKSLKLIKHNGSELFPNADVIQKLAHVRVQEHTELKDLNLPKETSILVSHRIVEPTKYHAFVCYYAYSEGLINLKYLPKEFIKQNKDSLDQLENENIFSFEELKLKKPDSELVKKIEALQEEDKNNARNFYLNTDISNCKNEYAVILNEWSFESIGAELYQVNKKKLEKYPHKDQDRKLPDSYEDSEIISLDLKKLETLTKEFKPFQSLIKDNNEYQNFLTEIELKFINELKSLPETTPPTQSISGSKIKEWLESKADVFKVSINKIKTTNSYTINEFQKILESDNNHILEYLQYNGKNLKGYLHELDLQPFKTNQYNNLPDVKIQKLLNISKVPLEHQLKAGGKMMSWYQGPFTNNTSKFDLLQLLADQQIETIPDHQDYLNLFNEDTGMYDMTYSAAWQLGRLMIMNDNKVLQELKKWKYDLELYNLVLEQNKLSHLPNLSIQAPSIPDVLMNYVTDLIQFRNFPLYYLLPHKDLSTEETIKYFKIDNSWILAFLFGIFSAGPKLKISDFTKYLYRREIFDREDIKEWSKIKPQLESLLQILKLQPTNDNTLKIEVLQKDIIEQCTSVISSNMPVLESYKRNSSEANRNSKTELEKVINFYNRIIEILYRIKNEMWYVFNIQKNYYGILLQSQTIKNWPHLVVELEESHDFHYVTTINNTLRLYITDKPFSKIEMYLKNENAHFGKEFNSNDNEFITIYQDSVTTANNNLYKQPRVVFNINLNKTNAESEK